MSVVKQPSPGFSRTGSNDQIAQNNLVRLTDADRVRDEPKNTAFRPGPRDTSSTFVFETNLRGDLGKTPERSDAIDQLPPREDEWSGLEIDQTLGQLMTQTRKHSGLSREQVADRTRIPAYYVRMIESDSYDAIPDQLYLLPFFRRYADFLGLDAKKVVSRFICDFEKAENEVVATPASTAYAKALQRWRQVAARNGDRRSPPAMHRMGNWNDARRLSAFGREFARRRQLARQAAVNCDRVDRRASNCHSSSRSGRGISSDGAYYIN
jgi:transcriptional regulator with XRE-family HTH domain